MKVIAKQDDSTYLVLIDHHEIEKVTDKYYGKLGKLKVGDEINLANGYDFRKDICDTTNKMTAAMESFDKARNTLMKFSMLIIDLENK